MSLNNPSSNQNIDLPERSSNSIVHVWEENAIPILSRNGNLYATTNGAYDIHKFDESINTWKHIRTLSDFRLRAFVTLNDGRHVAIIAGSSWIARFSPDFQTQELFTPPNDMLRKVISSHVGIDYNPDTGTIMFAEYNTNEDEPLGRRVWRSTDNGETWTEVIFDSDIRHWHSCQVDPFTGDWWIASGDTDAQTKMLRSTDNGDTWNVIGEGSQLWRAIRMVFTRDKVMWGTDDIGSSGSDVVVMDRGVWNATSIGVLDGPVLGNQHTVNGLCMMHTRIESPSPGNDIGRIHITDGVTVKEVFSYRRDKPVDNGLGGFTYVTPPDKYNRIWLNSSSDRLIGVSLPINI